tara:strand:- start:112 stop:1152 length:1041 start_codon:yes stop_codon:yes gene_type:complete
VTKAAELAKMGEVLTNNQIGGRRNIIINGNMKVAQRNTSATGLGGSSGYFGLDRFQLFFATSGRLTMSQEADGPSGFANSMKLACTTADTSIAATENIILSQAIEAQDLQQLKKGTSDAERFTLSFYVKGNASAAYSVEVYDADNNRSIGQTFSVTTSWNRVVLTFDADTSGALNDDNGVGFYVNWWLHAGSNYTSGTFNTTWNDYVNNARAGNTTSFLDSTDRTFFLTGVQLEVGSQATPFEHRSFGEELILCSRYFQDFTEGNTIVRGYGYNNTSGMDNPFTFKTPMRAAPTMTETAGSDASSGSDLTNFGNIKTYGCDFNTDPSPQNNQSNYYQFQFTADAEL